MIEPPTLEQLVLGLITLFLLGWAVKVAAMIARMQVTLEGVRNDLRDFGHAQRDHDDRIRTVETRQVDHERRIVFLEKSKDAVQ